MEWTEIKNREEWDKIVDDFGGHPLQYWGWGELKEKNGWKSERIVFKKGDKMIGGSQILVKALPMKQKMFFVPRGPFGSEKSELLKVLAEFAKNKKASFIKIEPEWHKNNENEKVLRGAGFKLSNNQVFIPRTAEITLKNLDEHLMNLRKKTRYHINRSMRDFEIKSIKTTDHKMIDQALQLYKITAHRAGFKTHPDEYYKNLAKMMGDHNKIYGAFLDGEMTAFSWNIASKTTEFALYGGSNETGRKLNANYGLKWTMVRNAEARGLKFYDFNGLLHDGLSLFKLHFLLPDSETMRIGTWDYYPSVSGKLVNSGIVLARKARRMIKK